MSNLIPLFEEINELLGEINETNNESCKEKGTTIKENERQEVFEVLGIYDYMKDCESDCPHAEKQEPLGF